MNVSIRNEILRADNKKQQRYVDTEQLIRFIDKYGVDFKEHKLFGFNLRLINFVYLMNYEQLKIFFDHKPNLILGSKYGQPYVPESVFDDATAIMILNVIIECYNNNTHFNDWKNIILNDGHYDKRIIITLENHDKRTNTFFELMRDRLIK